MFPSLSTLLYTQGKTTKVSRLNIGHITVTYIMHNTLCYVCNTPVMCYIHIKILCDIRQRQHQCFFVHAGATIFFMRHFLIRGLEIFETPVIFGTGSGEKVSFIDVISPVAYV